MRFAFWHWEGAGNDFILCDGRELKAVPTPDQTQLWCNREEGIGADGVIVFRPVSETDDKGKSDGWEMDYLNADGSRSFCGNGSRCLFAFLRKKGWMGDSGWLRAFDGDHAVCWDVDLELPGVELQPVVAPESTKSMALGSKSAWFADSGSPHHMEFLGADSLEAYPVQEVGSSIRYAAMYEPSGTNVSFVAISEDVGAPLRMRTYERGVESETKACGTGATAVAVSDHAIRGGAPHRTLVMPGGTLHVSFDPPQSASAPYTNVWLVGPANQIAAGIWDVLSRKLIGLFLLLSMAGATGLAGTGWTDSTEISVLTISPGADLYSAWGHTAIRVYDPGHVPPRDVVYNYGTFVFNDGFYLRFLKGRLDYQLSRSDFGHFQYETMRAERAILEQPLVLKRDDVHAVVAYLEWNHLPENRVYSYRFFHDNCASRVLLVLDEVFGDRWDSNCTGDPAVGVSYRQAIRPYIQGDRWAEAGIDFILGPRTDEAMPPCGSSFLPDGLMAQLSLARLDSGEVVGPARELLPPVGLWFQSREHSFWGIPLFWIGWVGIWTLIWSVRRMVQHRNQRKVPNWERLCGKMIQALAAVLGATLLMMWAATDHQDTWANWNLIWASPLLFLVGFKRVRCSRLGRIIHGVLIISIPLFLLFWSFTPQFVSLSSACLAWATWLSLDPWKVIFWKRVG